MPDAIVNYQGPYTAASLTGHLDGSATQTTCVCWVLVAAPHSPIAGAVVAATSHTRDLTGVPGYPGVTFKSTRGVLPTVIDTEAGRESAGLEVVSTFDDAQLTRAAVEAGDWAGATFTILTINYKALGMGQKIEFKGRVGQVQREGESFSAEARPVTAYSSVRIGRRTRTLCDVKRLGDGRCKVNTAANAAGDGQPITVTGTITAAASSGEFTDSGRAEPDGRFTHGEVEFLTGQNAGRRSEVRSYAADTFVLQQAMPYPVSPGDTYRAFRGCDRTLGVCSGVFANAINYRGQPFITNIEKFNQIERAQA